MPHPCACECRQAGLKVDGILAAVDGIAFGCKSPGPLGGNRTNRLALRPNYLLRCDLPRKHSLPIDGVEEFAQYGTSAAGGNANRKVAHSSQYLRGLLGHLLHAIQISNHSRRCAADERGTLFTQSHHTIGANDGRVRKCGSGQDHRAIADPGPGSYHHFSYVA